MTRVPAMPAAPWFPFSGKMITDRQSKSRRGNSQNILPTTRASLFPAVRPRVHVLFRIRGLYAARRSLSFLLYLFLSSSRLNFSVPVRGDAAPAA